MLDSYKSEKFDIVIMAGQSNAEGFGWGCDGELRSYRAHIMVKRPFPSAF